MQGGGAQSIVWQKHDLAPANTSNQSCVYQQGGGKSQMERRTLSEYATKLPQQPQQPPREMSSTASILSILDEISDSPELFKYVQSLPEISSREVAVFCLGLLNAKLATSKNPTDSADTIAAFIKKINFSQMNEEDMVSILDTANESLATCNSLNKFEILFTKITIARTIDEMLHKDPTRIPNTPQIQSSINAINKSCKSTLDIGISINIDSDNTNISSKIKSSKKILTASNPRTISYLSDISSGLFSLNQRLTDIPKDSFQDKAIKEAAKDTAKFIKKIDISKMDRLSILGNLEEIKTIMKCCNDLKADLAAFAKTSIINATEKMLKTSTDTDIRKLFDEIKRS